MELDPARVRVVAEAIQASEDRVVVAGVAATEAGHGVFGELHVDRPAFSCAAGEDACGRDVELLLEGGGGLFDMDALVVALAVVAEAHVVVHIDVFDAADLEVNAVVFDVGSGGAGGDGHREGLAQYGGLCLREHFSAASGDGVFHRLNFVK